MSGVLSREGGGCFVLVVWFFRFGFIVAKPRKAVKHAEKELGIVGFYFDCSRWIDLN
jgi:hypothetical protein